MLGRVKDAMADAAETLRRVFSDPQVREVRAGVFRVRAHAAAGPAAKPRSGLDPLNAGALAMPPLDQTVQERRMGPLRADLRAEAGWARWGAEATVLSMAPLVPGLAARVAVPPLPRRAEIRGRLEAPSRPATRRSLDPLTLPRTRRVDPALPGGDGRAGLEVMLTLPVAIQGEDIQRLPKGLWMRYSLQMVRSTGENVRNLEVLGLFSLPRKGVVDLRHDARRGRILVRLESEAVKAPRVPFILARRKDDGALLSCYLEGIVNPKGARKPATPASETGPAFPEMLTVVRARAEGDEAADRAGWALVAYAGAALGRIFPLASGETLIGRAPTVTVALMDSEVSRIHARLTLEAGSSGSRLYLEDLDSTNGTRVNGEELRDRLELKAGDRLGVGGHVLKLVAMDALERAFHETLLDLSTRDPLTGLANRGNALAEFQNRFGLSLRYDRPLSVVVCDLDNFKRINDIHGHGAGDFVLQTFGVRVRENLREADLAGRIGGEEFLMVLPETDLGGGRQFAERLRKAVAALPVLLPTGPLEFTCSLGVAERLGSDQEPGQLLARADAALYRAKTEGRNRVCVPAPLV